MKEKYIGKGWFNPPPDLRVWHRARKKKRRGKPDELMPGQIAYRAQSEEFLRSPEWRAVRSLVLKRFGAQCMKCDTFGSVDNPIQVDHIIPRSLAPGLVLDPKNLQPLCKRCNKAKGQGKRDYRRAALQRRLRNRSASGRPVGFRPTQAGSIPARFTN